MFNLIHCRDDISWFFRQIARQAMHEMLPIMDWM